MDKAKTLTKCFFSNYKPLNIKQFVDKDAIPHINRIEIYHFIQFYSDEIRQLQQIVKK